jgi:hypothetical protein
LVLLFILFFCLWVVAPPAPHDRIRKERKYLAAAGQKPLERNDP